MGEAAGCWDLTRSSSRADTHWSFGACYQELRSPGEGCFWQYENGERQKICKQEDGCGKRKRCAAVAFAPLSASAIAATQNYYPPNEPCKCSNYTTTTENGIEKGNCMTKYRGHRWCYVDNPTNCRDFTFSKKSGKFWSFGACYFE